MFFLTSLRLSYHKVVYTTSHLHQVHFSISLGFSRFFSLVFRTSNIWSLRNLIKQLFHSRLLDMRLVIANSALRASLAIYSIYCTISYPTRAHGIIVNYVCLGPVASFSRKR